MSENQPTEYEIESDSTVITNPFFRDVYEQALREARRLETSREISERACTSAVDSV